MPKFKMRCVNKATEKVEIVSCVAPTPNKARRSAEKQGYIVTQIGFAGADSSPPTVANNQPNWLMPILVGCGIAIIGLIAFIAYLLLQKPELPETDPAIQIVATNQSEPSPQPMAPAPSEATFVPPVELQQVLTPPTPLANPPETGGPEIITAQAPVESKEPEPTPPQPPVLVELSSSEIVRLAQPCVAVVRHPIGRGTGFAVAQHYLVTNSHVVDDAFIDEIEVVFPASGLSVKPSRLLYEERSLDLAVFELPQAMPSIEISDHPFVSGESVIIIGNPSVDGEALTNAVTMGLLSTITHVKGVEFHQISASINPGNSGGPVLNRFGQVIAVATLKAASQEGLAFGVPGHRIKTALQRIVESSDFSEVERRHALRAIYVEVKRLGDIYATCMRMYVEIMAASIRDGNSANDGIAVIRGKIDGLIADIEKHRSINQLEKQFQSTQKAAIGEAVKEDLVQYWSTLRELRSYATDPRGSLVSYRENMNKLTADFDRLKTRLAVRLEIAE